MDKTNNDGGPENIFLQPDCCVDWANEGRQWCEHDVWSDDCPEHSPATEYVRADLARQQAIAQHEGDSRAKHLADTRAKMIPGDRNTVPHEGDEKPLLADWHYIDLFRVIRDAGKSDRAKARAASEYVAGEMARPASTPATPAQSLGEMRQQLIEIFDAGRSWAQANRPGKREDAVNAALSLAPQITTLQAERDAAVAEVGRLRELLAAARMGMSVLLDTAADFTETDQANCGQARNLITSIDKDLETGDTSHAD